MANFLTGGDPERVSSTLRLMPATLELGEGVGDCLLRPEDGGVPSFTKRSGVPERLRG